MRIFLVIRSTDLPVRRSAFYWKPRSQESRHTVWQIQTHSLFIHSRQAARRLTLSSSISLSLTTLRRLKNATRMSNQQSVAGCKPIAYQSLPLVRRLDLGLEYSTFTHHIAHKYANLVSVLPQEHISLPSAL